MQQNKADVSRESATMTRITAPPAPQINASEWFAHLRDGIVMCVMCRHTGRDFFPAGSERRILDAGELNRYGKISVSSKRLQFLLSRIIVKGVIAQLAVEVPPTNVSLEADAAGRLSAAGANMERIHISISYTEGLVATAFALAHVGIDVEKVRSAPAGTAQRFFTKRELAHLRNSEFADEEFFRIWTLKESYAKLTGGGIFDALKNTECVIGETVAVMDAHMGGKTDARYVVHRIGGTIMFAAASFDAKAVCVCETAAGSKDECAPAVRLYFNPRDSRYSS